MNARRVLAAAALAAGGAIAAFTLPRPLLAIATAACALGWGAWMLRPALRRARRERGEQGAGEAAPSQLEDAANLLQPLAEGVLLLDEELRVLAANASAARILGQPPGAMAGATLIQAVRDHDLAQAVREAAVIPVAVHLSGVARDVRVTSQRMSAGRVRLLVAFEDVTELVRAQRARIDLVGNVSHELRTPIAAARALAETLQAGVEDPAAQRRFVDRLAEEIGRIGRIVERLLRLARLDSGREAFQVSAVPVAWLVETAAERMAPIATQRGVVLELAPGGASRVQADPERALEVLANLLDNAIRHSPEGGHVRLEVAEDEDEGAARFSVTDEGPGILPSDRERVFERFYTGDVSPRRGRRRRARPRHRTPHRAAPGRAHLGGRCRAGRAALLHAAARDGGTVRRLSRQRSPAAL